MLEVQEVSKSFNRKVALDQVSLHVNKGEIYGLLGPNGAGKTSLIRIINQIIEPDQGAIRFGGELMRREHLKHIGYLPEERGLYRTMTVQDHALFLGRLRGMDKARVKEQLTYWLEKFDIGALRNKRIEELSKGMAQKVQFICTVLHAPEVLILDEPMSGFDPLNVELIKQELLELKKQGKTIMLSTHNMKSVDEICDRAALIDQSKKLAEGKVTELRQARSAGQYAVKFSGNMLAFVNALWTGFELIHKEELDENRFVAHVKLRGDSSFEDLLKVLMGQVRIEAAWEVVPSMHDVFIGLINDQKTAVHEN